MNYEKLVKTSDLFKLASVEVRNFVSVKGRCLLQPISWINMIYCASSFFIYITYLPFTDVTLYVIKERLYYG
jgi:hypothetical protein